MIKPLIEDAEMYASKLSNAKMEISDAKSFIEFQKKKIKEIKRNLVDELTPSWYTGPCFVKVLYEINDYGYDENGNIDVISGAKWFEKETPVLYMSGFSVAGDNTDELRLTPKLYWVCENTETGLYDKAGGKFDLFDRNESILIKSITVLKNA